MDPKHYPQIDVLKGLMICFIVLFHSCDCNIQFRQHLPGYEFLVYSAVPVLLILMGLNAYLSMEKQHPLIKLKKLYSRSYFQNRFERIFVPYSIIFIISLILGIILNNIYIGIYTLFLKLPLSRGGNYFISLAFQVALIAPLLYYCYKRKPRLTMLTCFIVALIYSYLIYRYKTIISLIIPPMYLIFYALFLLVLGMFLADKYENNRLRKFLKNHFILIPGFILGCFFLIYFIYAPENAITDQFGNWYQVRWIFAPIYYLVIVLLGLRFLPKNPRNKLTRLIERIGKASFHVYLVQLLWFACLLFALNSGSYRQGSDFLIKLVLISSINLLYCIMLGLLFYEFDKKYLTGRLRKKKE